MEIIIKPRLSIKAAPDKVLFVEVISAVLILLWIYASLSKLADYTMAEYQMHNQIFPSWLAGILVWAVPVSELITAALLSWKRSRKAGLFISMLLLSAFTIYIILVMANLFGRIPCNCGGIISRMSWPAHLAFNLFFLTLAVIALKISTFHDHNNRSQQQRKEVS